jgi:hypothetical protein
MKSLEIIAADSTMHVGCKTVFIVGSSFSAFQLVSAGFTVCIKEFFLEKHSFFAENREVFLGYTCIEQLFEKLDLFTSNVDASVGNSSSKFFDGSLSHPSILSV